MYAGATSKPSPLTLTSRVFIFFVFGSIIFSNFIGTMLPDETDDGRAWVADPRTAEI